MNKQNLKVDYNEAEKEVERKFGKREKKKRPKMKVSGASVKRLQRIIKEK